MRGRGQILVTLCLAALIIILDIAIVNVALPALVRQLGATTTGLQWVVDAYNLARAVMGLGAAMMFPATLSLLTNVFTGRRERAVAIGVWGPVPGGHRAGPDYWPVTCSPRWLADATPKSYGLSPVRAMPGSRRRPNLADERAWRARILMR
jgi:hypothetical protein